MEIIPNWHPMFVHFTVALLTLAVILHIVCALLDDNELKKQICIVGRWNLWIGAAFTLVTVLTGWYAFNTVAHDDPAHRAMTDHRNWALVTAAVFIVLAFLSAWRYLKTGAQSRLLLAGLVIGQLLLVTTAWHGGELVYRHGLGVMSLPATGSDGDDGHDHDHGSADVSKDTQTGTETETKARDASEQRTDVQDSHDDHDHAH